MANGSINRWEGEELDTRLETWMNERMTGWLEEWLPVHTHARRTDMPQDKRMGRWMEGWIGGGTNVRMGRTGRMRK